MRPNLRIAQRLSKPLLYTRTITHIKHYRGYGVHSPFVYSLVRNVFMKRRLLDCHTELFDVMRAEGVSSRRSIQIQNLYGYCNYNCYTIDDLSPASIVPNMLMIVTKTITPEQIEALPQLIGSTRLTLCIVYPKNSTARNRACKKIVKSHKGMSIDNIGFLLLLFNDNRVKQHINL